MEIVMHKFTKMEKQELLTSLEDILLSDGSIKMHVDRVAEIREKLEDHISDEERLAITNKIKDRVQKEAAHYWTLSGSKGAVLMATGVGKSKVAINISATLASIHPEIKVLIVVPTEKLRDENWPDEFKVWKKEGLLGVNIKLCCYASLANMSGEEYGLVVFDEGHNLTPENSKFLDNNTVHQILWLSATKPRDMNKILLYRRLEINPVYEITLDEAVKLGLVAPYDITVVTTELYDGERLAYNKKNQLCFSYPSKFAYIDRMRFIYTLSSKEAATKWLLENLVPKEKRTIIFTGSKRRAISVCEHHYFSKPTKPKKLPVGVPVKKKQVDKYNKDLEEFETMMQYYQGSSSYDLFKQKAINRMSCVDALNEGENISALDIALVDQLNSNELNLWQRIGRIIRFRVGHIGKVIIVCALGTEDEKWVKKATANLDPEMIKWVALADLQSGKETINFN